MRSSWRTISSLQNMLDKDHKISIDPFYNYANCGKAAWHSGLCHTACLQPVFLVVKLPLKQHFFLVFPKCTRTKLSSEDGRQRIGTTQHLTCVPLSVEGRRLWVVISPVDLSLICSTCLTRKIYAGFCGSLPWIHSQRPHSPSPSPIERSS